MRKNFYRPLLYILAGCAAPSVALAATCTVPNAIANGQVADASKVMDNFNAVASCAEAGVTTTGTPATGNLPVFSGAGTITSGNLSGDVTTSGSTATTLAPTGVTPGTYSKANITVDAKGRVVEAANGSGGSGAWWFSPPLASSFTLGSGSATYLTLTDDADAGLLVNGGAPVSGDANRVAYRTIADKDSAWDLKMRVDLLIPTDNYSGAGIAIRDSTSGRISSYTLRGDGSISLVNWFGYSGFSATVSTTVPRTAVNWFRVQYDGTNYIFYISPDGKQWTSTATVSDTSWLTNKADQAGITVDYNRTSGIPNLMTVEHFSLIQ